MKLYTKAWAAAVCCFLPFQAAAIDIQVRDVPVRTVLEGLARSGQMNLIVDDSVEGTLTMTLRILPSKRPCRRLQTVKASITMPPGRYGRLPVLIPESV